MSVRDPSTWILREAGRGATAAESTFASRAKNWSLAFIVLLVAGASHGSGGRPTLPCAGIIRTGSKGVLSPTCVAGRTPSVDRSLRQCAAGRAADASALGGGPALRHLGAPCDEHQCAKQHEHHGDDEAPLRVVAVVQQPGDADRDQERS